MRIDLDENEIIVEVKHKGETYPLEDPKSELIMSYTEGLKKEDADAFQLFKDLMISIGLPKEVADDLGVFKMKKLMEGFSKVIEGKK